jgi:hypothetical protein
MNAMVDLPAADGTTGVHLDGEPVAATKIGDRWVLTDKVSGSVRIEVK